MPHKRDAEIGSSRVTPRIYHSPDRGLRSVGAPYDYRFQCDTERASTANQGVKRQACRCASFAFSASGKSALSEARDCV